MNGEKPGERRQDTKPMEAETRGALWSLPDGRRFPTLVEASPMMVVGDPCHPARLRPSDLENPDEFRSRLVTWLMQQG